MRRTWLLVAPLLLLSFFTAWSLFSVPSDTSYLDDEVNLAPLRTLQDDPSQFYYLVSENQSGIFGRSVSIVSFGVEVLLSGFSYEAFKKTNAVIHILNGALVGLLALFLFRLSSVFRQSARLLALCVAVFWLILPIHVSTVMYPVQRMAQLSALFVLLGLLGYAHGRVLIGTGNNWKGACFLSASFLVFLPLGLFSKENAILLLPLMFLLEMLIRESANPNWDKKVMAGWGVIFLLGLLLSIGLSSTIFEYINAEYRAGSPYLAFLTQSRIIFSYIREIVFPSNSRFGYFHDDINLSQNLFDPVETFFSVVGVVSLLVFSAFWLWKSKSLVGFGVLFFFVGHALESTILPLEFYFEHRNYLPSAGIIIALVSGGYWLGKKFKIEVFTGLLLVGFLSVDTFIFIERNQIWNDPEVGVAISELNHPSSPRSVAALAIYQTETGFYEASLRNLSRVQALKPELHSAVEIQKIYAKCINSRAVTKDDLGHFNGDFSLGSPRYFNQGVRELAKAVSQGRCSAIDYDVLAKLSNKFLSASSVHHTTHKVIAELMLANDAVSLAIDHLLEAEGRGGLDIRSRLLLFELLIAEGEFEEASKMVDDLHAGLVEVGVDSWLSIFQQAQSFLEAQSKER